MNLVIVSQSNVAIYNVLNNVVHFHCSSCLFLNMFSHIGYQQGDTHVLPLLVLGAAVKMICPVARPLTTVSCSPSAMVVNLGMFSDAEG